MIVIFIRHAARSVPTFAQASSLHGGHGDPPLNDLGRAQAMKLAELAKAAMKIPQPTHIYVSPKIRTHETLAPTAAAFNLKLKIDARLDECQSRESSKDFNSRILSLVNDFEKDSTDPLLNTKCVYACSHFDWLECVLPLLPSDINDVEMSRGWGNCELRAFDVSPGLWKFIKGGRVETN